MGGKLENQDIRALGDYFAHAPDVALAFLFGSQARGDVRADSDVDCAVLLDESVNPDEYFDRRLQLTDGAARTLHRDDIDLLILNDAPLALGYRVLRDGRLLFERDHDTYVRYRVRTLNLYFDFAPFLQGLEEMFLRRVSEEGLLYGHNPYHGTLEALKKSLGPAGGTAAHEP